MKVDHSFRQRRLEVSTTPPITISLSQSRRAENERNRERIVAGVTASGRGLTVAAPVMFDATGADSLPAGTWLLRKPFRVV